ncbi:MULTISPECIES: hypothetical protein [Pseudonocardia]|uniref:Uncharacterized protein n=2 Tax=Pseudonocardia TaxID=1847 RepID=A0A1Y2MJL7_PSEAH|nr:MULTISPECIES: hypothetical protein [Pseudonocardia]OSY34857.1 hypothetical protein BG845_06488 [Pseudonocardia autotrophica]TDN75444.1 hypothetical protein C8E95_4610 [Pseudonocardia autotrophica]BBF99409.1 hypothetical protein Pdca_06190 [Pseudonocardia autotrophica]GEC29335.1 hypothetical protein PSA01_63640 [Pseudonocardia saturnea]
MRIPGPASAALLTVLVLGAGVVLLLAHWLFRVQEWEGEVPAVVAGFGRDHMYVALVEPAPDGTLPGSPLPGWLPADPLDGVQRGAPLTCLVRQTYQVNRHLATGARTEVLSCRA